MEIIGVIVEYNPLHNGHLHHYNMIKEKYPNSLVIGVMSGYTSERGEISVFDKFTKTKLALTLGVDIVCEMPFIYTNNNAEIFSSRSIDYLNYLHVSKVVIGSEANLANYDTYLTLLDSEKYNLDVKSYLKKGFSFKEASIKAMEDSNIIPLKSNDTLGLFYYKRIKEKKYNITLESIQRQSNHYNDKELSSNTITSATSIRNTKDDFKKYVPSYVYDRYTEIGFLDENLIFPFLKYELIRNNYLKDIALTSEGFYNTLKNNSKTANLNDLRQALTSKRYTTSRVNRILLNTLFDIRQPILEKTLNFEINYIRVLGFNKVGKLYLNSIKKDLNIYTNIKEGINIILDTEIKVSKTLGYIYNKNYLNLEQGSPVIIK